MSRSHTGWMIALACLCTLLFCGSALGAPVVHTWTGGGGNQLWSNAGNWDASGVPVDDPVNGTVVQFGTGTTSTMDINGLIVDEVHFTGASNTINGSGGRVLSLRGTLATNNILADAAGNTFAATLPLALVGTSTIFAKSNAGQITIAGPIGGTTAGLRVLGAGASGVTLTGTNTYTTATTVGSGTLRLNNGAVNQAIVGSTLTVGAGGGPGATLVLDQSSEIAEATNVTVGNDGTFDAAGFGESFNNLTVTGGAVTLGSGSVTVNGNLAMTGGTISGTGTVVLKGGASATSSASATAVVSALVSLNGDRAFTVADGPQATDATLSNVISNGLAPASALSKDGPGTLLLSTGAANTYTGGTRVNDGVLLLDGASSGVIPGTGTLTIGDGSGAASSATVRLGQLSEIANAASITIARDGLLDLNGFFEGFTGLTVDGGELAAGAGYFTLAGAATINDGKITLGASNTTITGLLTMNGGTIAGPSTGALLPVGNVQATSSAAGPATISAAVRLNADRTFTVTPGATPELVVDGVVGDAGGGFGLTKAGAGTLVAAGTSTYSGTTTVAAGTLIANGVQPGPFAVGTDGRLAGTGTVGATTVAGTLHPAAPALRTGALTFAATGKLDVDVPSAAATPKVVVTGAVTIDPAARLDLHPAGGLALPVGTKLALIDNDAADGIGGRFANAPAGGVFTAGGMPFAASYAGGSGNDLEAAVANRAPVIGAPVTATPNPATVGQAVALGVSATDANGDQLTIGWDFGDGTTGAGATTTHAYAAAGSYTATATVSDGTAQARASTVVTVTAPVKGAPPAACTDRVAPVTTIAKLTLTRKGLALSGRTSDLRCGVKAKPARVDVAIARRSGKRCRWLGAKGLSSCAKVPAKALRRATGVASYSIKIKRAFAPGTYVVVALARDAAGNAEKPSSKLAKTRRVR